MLAGKGFSSIYNLSGGIKAWHSQTAVGEQTLGLDLFSGEETAEKTLAVAYALEEGLRDFYLAMIPKVAGAEVKALFKKLSDIEIKHQDRLFEEYRAIATHPVSREVYEKTVVGPAVEGGLTTEEYVDRYQPDYESPQDIIGLAMAIEAQAFDLYTRAAERSRNEASKQVLQKISDEERAHLNSLGGLMDAVVTS
jgi:sulfur-carrier protein adenylyltransferase/sulfurtransferase